MPMTREQAWDLLTTYNKEPFHLRHAVTVERVMGWYARELGYGEEAGFWSIVGLLHDLDFEQWPEEHCVKSQELMRQVGVEESVIRGLGIEKDWQNRFPAEISGGEMQRFCIARALGKRTRFLLADEISTMLDLITQSQIWSFLVEEVEKREIGLLAVSHSMPLLEQVCTRICYLEEKKD